MNGDIQHVDGDDYTWEAGPVQAGAVLYPADNGGPPAANDSPEAWAADIGRLAAGMWVALDSQPAEPDTDSPEAWRAAVPGPVPASSACTAAAWVERWQRCAAAPDLRTFAEREQDDVAELYRLFKVLHAAVLRTDRRLAALAAMLEVRLP